MKMRCVETLHSPNGASRWVCSAICLLLFGILGGLPGAEAQMLKDITSPLPSQKANTPELPPAEMSGGGLIPAERMQGDGIRPGDFVYVEVKRYPHLSVSSTIDADGQIEIPHVGPVRIGGLSEEDAAKRLTDSLSQILRTPPLVRVSRGASAFMGPQRSAEMRTELIPLQNSDADEMSTALQGMTTAGGSISYDPGTHMLIITDTPDTVRNIMSVVARLDERRSRLAQVRIQARIAEVRVGALKELGVRWFFQSPDVLGGYLPYGSQSVKGRGLRGGMADPQSNEFIGAGGAGGGGGGLREYVEEGLFDRRLAMPVNVPKVGQLFLGVLTNNIDLGVMLDALVEDDDAQLLAAPNILTINHKPALIESIEQFPVSTALSTYGMTATSVQYVDIGIRLEVTPHVREDDTGPYVNMKLTPEVSYLVGTSNGAPVRSLRRSEQMANVRDGQTLVLGGIYRNDQKRMEQGVPGLRSVPVVGSLFKHVEEVNEQTELMVFVTPSIHATPDSVTWERMLDMPTARAVLDDVPLSDSLRERRKE